MKWADLPKIEDTISDLIETYNVKRGSYDYSDPDSNFSVITKDHFKKKNWGSSIYGVYIIRNRKTSKIIYIGKAGTFKKCGYGKQDLLGRLSKGRRKFIRTSEWIKNIYNEIGCPLSIEYLILPKNENHNRKPIPAFIEGILLQAFINEYGCLPSKNKEF